MVEVFGRGQGLRASLTDRLSLISRGMWHMQLLVRCATHWAFRIHTLPFFTSPLYAAFAVAGCICNLHVDVDFCVCVRMYILHFAFASACCICISHLRVASAFAFAFALCDAFAFRVCVLHLHCRLGTSRLRVTLSSRVRAFVRFTLACRSFRRGQFYSAARKSHTTQTSTRLSFFTSKEKSCAQRVLTRGSRFRIVDEGKES